MILLAALLCNYRRGKCLIDVGTEGSQKADYNHSDCGEEPHEDGMVEEGDQVGVRSQAPVQDLVEEQEQAV
jgi:hypothetical protein